MILVDRRVSPECRLPSVWERRAVLDSRTADRLERLVAIPVHARECPWMSMGECDCGTEVAA